MRCGRYQKLLFLHRPGELDAEEIRTLQAHLASCARCASLARLLERDAKLIEELRSTAPQAADPEGLNGAILAAIQRNNPSRLGRFLDRLAETLERPRIRLAAAAFVCTVTLIFLIQQVTLALSVRNLEHRAAVRLGSRPTATLAYRVDQREIEGLAMLAPALERIIPGGPHTDSLVVTSDALRDYEVLLRGLITPLPGNPLGATPGSARLEQALNRLAGSVSVSLKFQSPGG